MQYTPDESIASIGSFTDRDYWNDRYRKRHGISGDGSRGRLLAYKAHQINLYAEQYGWRSFLDLGCGDGFILPLIQYESYIGYDISDVAVEYCRKIYEEKKHRRFFSGNIGNIPDLGKYDVALSLDVAFHITDEQDYFDYLKVLARSARYAVVFGVNATQDYMTELVGKAPHVYYRPIADDLKAYTNLKLVHFQPCPFYSAWDKRGPGRTYSQFYIFRRQ